jgi:hypothetical protein
MGDDYGAREDGTLPDLTPFIATAGAITDRVAERATADGVTTTDDGLELLERWLAAHCYAQSDRPTSFRGTDRAQATFDGKTGMHLQSTLYGQTAMVLDPTGFLAVIGGVTPRRVARGTWLGKRRSEQTDYDLRG